MSLAILLVATASAVLAWIAAWRAEHRPIAWTLSLGLFVALSRTVLSAWVLPPRNPDALLPPLEGALLVAQHLVDALGLAFPFAVAAMALRVLAGRRAWPMAIGYAVTVVAIVAGYPALHRVNLAVALATGLVGVGALVEHQRGKGSKVPRGSTDAALAGHRLSVRVATVLVAGEFAFGLLARRVLIFIDAPWPFSLVVHLVMFSAVALLHAQDVWRGED